MNLELIVYEHVKQLLCLLLFLADAISQQIKEYK